MCVCAIAMATMVSMEMGSVVFVSTQNAFHVVVFIVIAFTV